MHLSSTWRTKFSGIVTCVTTNSFDEALVEIYSQAHLNWLGSPTRVFPSCATRELTQWDPVPFTLTTLSATLDVTELSLSEYADGSSATLGKFLSYSAATAQTPLV